MRNARTIRVVRIPGTRSKGRLRFLDRTMPCAIGKGGISTFKREGDGASPRGRFHLRRVWLRPGQWPSVVRARLPIRYTRPNDGWCDDARHARYNRPVALPFPASHERMWRDDALYDIVIEIGWNDRPAIKGRGSAIFMHLARPGFTATEGCVALTRADMQWLLARLTPQTHIMIG